MAKDITLFLMFDGCAEQAINHYVSLFANSEIDTLERYEDENNKNGGGIKFAVITLNGMRIMCIDSNKKRKFTFTPSTSLFVDCSSEREIEFLFSQLAEEGEVLMPLDDYGLSKKFTWIKDRFGLSWQLNLKKLNTEAALEEL